MFPLKAFYWGQKGARDNFALQIRNIAEAAYRSLGENPVILGECGVPMDMKSVEFYPPLRIFFDSRLPRSRGQSFETDDWVSQSRMMDAMITGLERSLVGFT